MMTAKPTRTPQLTTNSERLQTLRAKQQAWVQRILASGNLNYTKLAELCGFNRTTLTRLFETDSSHVLRSDTVDKIAARFGPMEGQISVGLPSSIVKSRGFIEASPYAANDDANIEAIVEAITSNRNGCAPFELQSDALMTLGYLRGDILFVDLNATPSPGDIVCVQLYNWDDTSAGTVFHVFQGEWLVLPGSIGEPPPPPIAIKSANLAIMGPVTEMVRPRRSVQSLMRT